MKKRVMGGLILLISILLLNGQSSHAFELNGFGSVSFTKSTDGADEFRNGDFAIGAVDLYLAESLDDIEVLSEIVVESGGIDLERVTIGYTFSDALRVRVGRFHTPLGFWNASYHHGVQLQPTIDRPEFLKFEDAGGILPVHVVGGSLSGFASTAVGAVEYGAMIGNGPKITSKGGATVLDPNNTEDNNIGKAVAFNAAISPAMVQGLKIGVSGYIAEVSSEAPVVPAVTVDQAIWNASLIYAISNIDFLGEYFSIKDEEEAISDSFKNSAYYGLIRYTYKEKWVPYILWEHQSVKENDPYLTSLGKNFNNTESMLGLRYNINYRSSVKVEGRAVKHDNDNWNEYAVQWALAF